MGCLDDHPGSIASCTLLQVLYLDVVQDMELERLKHIAELVHASFSAHGLIDGLQAGRSEAFTPHLTVAKLSQLIKQGRGKSRHLNKSLKMLPQVQS